MPRHQRKRFFIDREFQGRYIFNAFISVAIGSILFALIFSFFSSNTLSIAYEDYHLKLGTTPELLLDKIFSTQWLFIVLGGLIVALVTLFLSHRVAGPAYRFEQTLGNMISKDLTGRIHLRKHDEGKALGRKIDEFNDMLSISLGKLMEISGKIQRCCDDRLPSDDEMIKGEALLSSRLEEIRRYNQESLELLGEFKLR